ncbi:MAG: DUF2442 domain-containing protein [Verrucomicrobia bacterium]|nr:DUF2442 domain-containing protein [Verrucomicrobiota bacterium]MDA1085845.1 DUF2442 domain-containing protein [Verrucomicrobiota bacterium]
MKSLVSETQTRATSVRVSRGWVIVRLDDNREMRFRVDKSRRLREGTAAAVQNVELVCNGTGLHWPELDEDLSLQGILEGRFGYDD